MTGLVPRPDGATRVVLLRHTETTADAEGVVYGALDVGLSPAGAAHAHRLGIAVATTAPVAVYSSPRRRTMATASAVTAITRQSVRPCDRLREMDFGAFEGRRYDDLRREQPVLYDRWMTDPTGVRFPGGESFADLRARATAELTATLARHRGATTVLATHGGVVRALLAHTLGMQNRDAFRIDQAYGAVNVIDFFGKTPLVRIINGSW